MLGQMANPSTQTPRHVLGKQLLCFPKFLAFNIISLFVRLCSELRVEGYELADGKTTYYLFKIKVVWDALNSWHVRRRFSEFVSLKKEFLKEAPELPDLPKTWPTFSGQMDESFLAERKKLLQKFLNVLLESKVLSQPSVLGFVGIIDPYSDAFACFSIFFLDAKPILILGLSAVKFQKPRSFT